MKNETLNPFPESIESDGGEMIGDVFFPHSRSAPFGETRGTVRAAMGNAILYAQKINKPIKADVNGLVVIIEASDTVDSAMAKRVAKNKSPEQKALYEAQTKKFNEKVDADLARALDDVDGLDFNDEKSLMDWVDRYVTVLEICGDRDIGAKKILAAFAKHGFDGNSYAQAERVPFKDPKTIINYVLGVLKQGMTPSVKAVGPAITRWKMDRV